MILKILLVVLGLTLSTYLFKKAAGTLNVRKLNLISYTYYLFILQTFIGTSLMYLGDRGHYTLKYVINEVSIDRTYYYVLLTAVMFPLIIVVVYKLLRVNISGEYYNYLEEETEADSEEAVFYIILIISLICVFLMVLLFIKIGYVPLFKLIFGNSDFNFKTERVKVAQISIINQYVKNILVLSIIPVLSYIAFVYGVKTRKAGWIILFGVLFICSICTKTYNFAKTPVIFYLFTLVLLYIILNNGIKRLYFYSIIGALVAIIFLLYKVMGVNLGLSLYNGPIGRTLFTQAGTLIYHFDFFPESFPFLGGRSFASSILGIVGSSSTSVRSAKIIMSFYGSHSVYEGIAGVMNALFIGEAYANYGDGGVIFSILYVALLFGLILVLFTTKLKKTALNVALLGVLTSELANTTQGGFFDFLYNANMIVIVIMFVFVTYAGKYLSKKLSQRKYKFKY